MLRSIYKLERLATLLLACLSIAPGCVLTMAAPLDRFDYFGTPARNDPWSAKIFGWQRRERADHGSGRGAPSAAAGGEGVAPATAAGNVSNEPASSTARTPSRAEGSALAGGLARGAESVRQAVDSRASLRSEYSSFLIQRKRAAARELADWVQYQAKRYYIPDGPVDHWATLEETLRADGDDCDGLELLVFHGLLELGFDESEVFRSIVYRPSDGQHHMVTLWFEDAEDPWVIDPTGAMTTGLHRMSQLPAWKPLKIFTEHQEYSVRARVAVPGARPFAASP